MSAFLVIVSSTTLIASCETEPDAVEPALPAPPPELPRMLSQPLAHVRHGPLEVHGPADLFGGGGGAVGGRRITQRLLVLGATGQEPAYLAAVSAIARIGIPYRGFIAATEALTPTLLGDGASNCYFSGVVVATSGLGFTDPATNTWQSALTPAEWLVLQTFERACSAREVTWYGWPGAEFGLAAGSAFDSNTAVDGRLTTAGQAIFHRVKTDARIPYRSAYGYRATIADPTTTVSLIEAVDGGVLVAKHTTADGREMMVSTVDANPYLTHALLLEYDMIRWVSRDLFVGKKRAYLSAQIDDLFIDDDVWVVGAGNLGTTQLRITGADLTAFLTWQGTRQASLPATSTFATTMAFNAVGTQTSEYADTTLLTVARSTAGKKLRWLNHTWDHENLDAMARIATLSEVATNCTTGRMLTLTPLDCSELVTPDMSGLVNLNAVRGMLDAGVRWVVSDSSHTAALFPTNPGDNPSFNVGRTNSLDARLYHIPRHPTSIFYDTTSPATETDEYNKIYRAYYGRDLSFAEVLDKDSAFGLYYLLQGDVDPLMFHQTNLASYTSTAPAGLHSLYGDWVDAVLGKFLALSNVPVVTLREAEIGTEMVARSKLNACGVTATKVETPSIGTGWALELRTTGACSVPVTGVSAPSFGPVELYAGEPLTSFTMPANGVRVIQL
jgi:hypothetical protein